MGAHSCSEVYYFNSIRGNWLVDAVSSANPSLISSSQECPLNLYLKEEMPSAGLS